MNSPWSCKRWLIFKLNRNDSAPFHAPKTMAGIVHDLGQTTLFVSHLQRWDVWGYFYENTEMTAGEQKRILWGVMELYIVPKIGCTQYRITLPLCSCVCHDVMIFSDTTVMFMTWAEEHSTAEYPQFSTLIFPLLSRHDITPVSGCTILWC